jgi:molecular chaperone GrpE
MNEQPTTAPANDSEQAPETASAASAGPESRIAALEAELAGAKDQALRALAEAENVRRRTQKDADDARKFAVATFARDLLAVADNLGRALQAIPPEKRAGGELATLYSGIELTERELASAMERNGIKPVDPKGERFDPNLHQAMFEVEDSTAAPGTVLQVIARGYTIHGRLLRPAMVGVAKAASAQAQGQAVDTKA